MGLPLVLALLLLVSADPRRAAGQDALGDRPTPVPALGRAAELVGRELAVFPHFEYVRSFNQGDPVQVGIDPFRHPELVGRKVHLYVVERHTREDWIQNPRLVDVSGGHEEHHVTASGILANTRTVDAGSLPGAAGLTIGTPYDVVVDLDRDGLLGPEDLVDGLRREPGFFVVGDLTALGPLEVSTALYSGGHLLDQMAYWPTAIGGMGRLPLVIVSHGNGHNYRWYNHIGYHLASHGYVVMSHSNNTGPGPRSAATTTLTNTAYLIENQDTIAAGVLDGHIDATRMTWIGHSRGGEGVAIAYDRLIDRAALLTLPFEAADVRLISSIAPTDFEGPELTDPHDVAFHLWTGAADSDVDGCADCSICQTFHLHDRARGPRLSTSLHGVGHGDFHAADVFPFAEGPCLVGRPDTHKVMLGYLLPLIEYFVDGQLGAKDYLWRQWESFRPIGAPDANPCVTVDLMFQEGPGERLVLDDFQTNEAPDLTSAGTQVITSVQALLEDRFDDATITFNWNYGDPMNGMTLGGGADTSRGVVFEFDGSKDFFYTLEVPAEARDFRRFEFLSFRAAQGTRHPYTDAEHGDLTFSVSVVDGFLRSSTIRIDAYGGGIEEPYQRTGCGRPNEPGWNNEFETVRIRLSDFARDGHAIDLENVIAVGFLFGPSHGSPLGRIGLDEIQLTRD